MRLSLVENIISILNKMGDAFEPQSNLEPYWQSKPRPLRIVSIGAGATGLLVAYKLKRTFQNYTLAIYDK